jgi:hypothetical protein
MVRFKGAGGLHVLKASDVRVLRLASLMGGLGRIRGPGRSPQESMQPARETHLATPRLRFLRHLALLSLGRP